MKTARKPARRGRSVLVAALVALGLVGLGHLRKPEVEIKRIQTQRERDTLQLLEEVDRSQRVGGAAVRR